jgi:ferredoxin-like protein FixX
MARALDKKLVELFADRDRRVKACPGHVYLSLGSEMGCEVRMCTDCGHIKHRATARLLSAYPPSEWMFLTPHRIGIYADR